VGAGRGDAAGAPALHCGCRANAFALVTAGQNPSQEASPRPGRLEGEALLPEIDDATVEPRAAPLPGDALAAELRGFGPVGILSLLVILAGNLLFVPLSAVLVLLWAWRSRTPWHAIGYARPASWAATVAVGICLGATFKLLMKAIVMPLLGAPAINPAYHHLAGNAAALPGMLYAVIVGAGFGEETVFRGYLFERLGSVLGTGTVAKVSIVWITSALFALAHYVDQGFFGVAQAMVVGLVFGAIFAVRGRIWMLMFAHAAFDVVAVAIIYWNLESTVAHFIFN
jgi:membrane protease YdiL (CAAX protease family)